jgi:hypothetical protein
MVYLRENDNILHKKMNILYVFNLLCLIVKYCIILNLKLVFDLIAFKVLKIEYFKYILTQCYNFQIMI